MKLEDIGFYTLSDERAERAGNGPLVRCELLITDKCNFKCPYCRGCKEEDKGSIKENSWKYVLQSWVDEGLENVRFSGGEPTLHPDLIDMVKFCKENGVKRIAISTNGSMPFSVYQDLLDAGVNDFSVSLDACCAEVGDKMAGGVKGSWQKVVDNIKKLSALTYVTVGVVVNEENYTQLQDTVEFASSLGVSDVRIISAAQYNKLEAPNISDAAYKKHPILKYRINNIYMERRPVRGIHENDTEKCHLVKDDMAVLNGKHYPCIIYLREGGKEIGKVGPSMREERLDWFETHNSKLDPICSKNCLDVCVEYNNKCKTFSKP